MKGHVTGAEEVPPLAGISTRTTDPKDVLWDQSRRKALYFNACRLNDHYGTSRTGHSRR